METLLQDLRYGARMLLKNPGFSAVAIMILALGIGANSAIFSVVNGLLLRPLPYKDSDRLVRIWEYTPGQVIERPAVAAPNFVDWRERNRVFEHMAAFAASNLNLTLSGETERIAGIRASAGIFPLLGVDAALGRVFSAEEDRPGYNRIVLLSHGLWQRRFGADSSIIGKPITINEQSHTVVGILPASFIFPGDIQVWLPLALDPNRADRGSHFLSVIARLRPEVTLKRARAEMDTIASQLAEAYPKTNRNYRVLILPLQEALVEDIQLMLLVLLTAVGLVLLIACVNIASLLLARTTARQKEIAVRVALGATRLRLVRQLITESLLLAVLGGLLGFVLSLWGVDALMALQRESIARTTQVRIDHRVLGFTLGVSLLTGLLFGLAPALQACRTDLHETLKEGSQTSGVSFRRSRLRSLLVVSEVALTLVLVISTGLMARSFLHLQQVDPGLRAENILTMRLSLSGAKYTQSHLVGSFFHELLERVERLPGVTAAGTVLVLPFSGRGGWDWGFVVENGPPVELGASHAQSNYQAVSPNYFVTMGIRLLNGRSFTENDTANSPGVVIVNQSLAQRFWPNEDPIGKRLKLGGQDSTEPWLSIVGVVNDVRYRGLDAPTRLDLYVPHAQRPQRDMFLVVHTALDPRPMTSAIRRVVSTLDKDQPVFQVRTLEEVISQSTAPRRQSFLLLACFSVAAFSLAMMGIYGVLSYSVSQRTREIGIRVALGAVPRDIIKLIVKQGMALIIIGVSIGLLVAFGLTRVMSSLLYGVSTTDPLTFMSASLLLAAVGLMASYIPARKATKVDPMMALRYE